jgi:hypothetical protein
MFLAAVLAHHTAGSSVTQVNALSLPQRVSQDTRDRADYAGSPNARAPEPGRIGSSQDSLSR